MTNITTTLEKPCSSTLQWTLYIQENSYEELFDNLTEILLNNEHANDPLSLKLFEWGANVCEIDINSEEDTIAFKEIARKKVHALQRILTNPMTNTPLISPVLDGDWIWEKSMLEDYLTLSSISPYTEQSIDMRVHSFALQMIKWLGSAQEKLGIIRELNPTPLQFNTGNSDKSLVRLFYEATAKSVKEKVILNRELNSRLKELQTLNTLIPLQIESTRIRTEEAFSQHEENILNLLKSIKSIYSARINLLYEKVDSQNLQIKTLKKRVNQCESEIQKIKKDLNNARQETHNVRCELQRVANESGGGGCSIQ